MKGDSQNIFENLKRNASIYKFSSKHFYAQNIAKINMGLQQIENDAVPI